MEGMVLMMLYIIIAVSFWYYPVRLGLLPRLFLNCADQCAVRVIGINYCDIIRLSRFIQRRRLRKKKQLNFDVQHVQHKKFHRTDLVLQCQLVIYIRRKCLRRYPVPFYPTLSFFVPKLERLNGLKSLFRVIRGKSPWPRV